MPMFPEYQPGDGTVWARETDVRAKERKEVTSKKAGRTIPWTHGTSTRFPSEKVSLA